MEREVVLKTADLSLEPLLPAHAADLYDGLRDDRIYNYVGQRAPASKADLAARFLALCSRRSPDSKDIWLNWALRRNTGDYVGWVQATVHRDRSAHVAYLVFPAFWRKAYAWQACVCMLEHLRVERGVTRAIATVDTENVPSIRLLEKLGFTLVSTEKAADMENRLEHRYEKRF